MPEWPNGLQCHAACSMDGHRFQPPQMLVDTLSAGMYLAIILTSVHLACVTPELTLKDHTGGKVCKKEIHLDFET